MPQDTSEPKVFFSGLGRKGSGPQQVMGAVMVINKGQEEVFLEG